MDKLSIAVLGNAQDQEIINHLAFLAQRGHEVRLLSSVKTTEPLPDGVQFKKISTVNYPFTYLTFVFTLPRMLLKRPQIIHAFNLSDYGVLGSLFARLARIKPLVLTAKGKDVLIDAKTHKGWAIKHMMPLASLFLSEDEDAAQEMIRMGAPVNKVRTLQSRHEEQLRELENEYQKLTAVKRRLTQAKNEKGI